MCDCEAVNVLVLMPSRRTRYAIKTLPEGVSKRYRFFFLDLTSTNHSSASLQDYLQDAKGSVNQKEINVVITNSDCGAFVLAALAQEYPHLRGPSVESVLLGYNKYYTRCLLDPQPIPFACLDLTATNLDQACEEVLQKVGIPAFFKPSSLSGSRGIASIFSAQELKDFARSYIRSPEFSTADVDVKFMNPFYTKNLDEGKYPLATRPTAIVEKHMGDGTRVNADGYVFEGEIFHWSISDSLFSQSKPRYYFGAAVPTTLPESTQQKVWKEFDAVVGKMISFGYNDAFTNVELFVLDSGEVKLMEVNPRKGGNLLRSGDAFRNGNATLAQLQLAEGKNPGLPVPNGHHGFYSYIRTCGSGRAREFYDYSYTQPGLIPEVDPDCLVDGSGESGTILCRTCLSGDSREEVLENYKSICSCVLLKPELSVWK